MRAAFERGTIHDVSDGIFLLCFCLLFGLFEVEGFVYGRQL